MGERVEKVKLLYGYTNLHTNSTHTIIMRFGIAFMQITNKIWKMVANELPNNGFSNIAV